MAEPDVKGEPTLATGARWAVWSVIVGSALLRATSAYDPFPSWTLDPTRAVSATSSITPAMGLALDAAVLAAAGLGLALEAFLGRGVKAWMVVLGLIGCVPAAWHGLAGTGARFENAVTGATWASAVLGAVAMAHLCRDARLARMTAALVAGACLLMVARAGLQVFWEHPQTVERFRASREAVLAAQGFTPGSVAAQIFERRLIQPEATAWVGMSNVLGSMLAAGMVMFLAWGAISLRRASDALDRPSEGWIGVLLLSAAACGFGLWLTRSKGAMAAGALGAAVVAAAAVARQVWPGWSRSRWERLGALTGVAAIAGALVAVVARGAVGERIDELSLLFRWFYAQAAVRIGLDHPLVGVGPAGFKDAYLLAKPALSPEEVSSPHSVLLDWWATLGVMGLAWGALLLGLAWGAGRRAAELVTPSDPDEAPTRAASSLADARARMEARTVALLAAAVVVGGAAIEREALPPESALIRGIGLLAWIGAGLSILAVWRTRVGAGACAGALGAGAIALLAHSQIELTAVWPASAALAMVVIGSAASGKVASVRDGAWSVGRTMGLAGSAAVVGLGAMVLAGPWRAASRWEANLSAAAEAVRPMAEVNERLSAIVAAGGQTRGGDSMSKLATDLGGLIGEFPPQNPRDFDRAMAMLLVRTGEPAAKGLSVALEAAPSHLGTREALVRTLLGTAAARQAIGDRTGALAAADRAVALADGGPESAGGLSLRAAARVSRAELGDAERLLGEAYTLAVRAAELDPHGPSGAWRAMELALRLGRSDEARSWARRVLEVDGLQRLDPLRRLSDDRRELAERLAGIGTGGGIGAGSGVGSGDREVGRP